MDNQFKSPPLPGFELESEYARRKGVNQRTVARQRQLGRIDYLEWAGRIWIGTESGDAYLRSLIKRRNPPRATRRRRQQSESRDTA
jgi:hypothetical protein